MNLVTIAAAGLVAGLLITANLNSSFAGEAALTEDHLQAYLKSFATTINKGDPAAVDALFAPDFVDHAPWPGHTPDAAGFRAGLAEMRQAFPDLNVTVEHTVAQDDMFTVHFRLSGTHLGKFMDSPPSGKTFSVEAIDINRMENGRIAEHWGVIDAASMMGQLGL
jgi:steroid delta-isomerase-like uncharacterized protein